MSLIYPISFLKFTLSTPNVSFKTLFIFFTFAIYITELASASAGSASHSRSIVSSCSSTAGPSSAKYAAVDDDEVAMATRGLSRQSSMSFNQNTPDEEFSGDSGSDRSSPLDI